MGFLLDRGAASAVLIGVRSRTRRGLVGSRMPEPPLHRRARVAARRDLRNPLPVRAPLPFNEGSARSRQTARTTRQTEGALMGAGDKMENAAEELGGKAKEAM